MWIGFLQNGHGCLWLCLCHCLKGFYPYSTYMFRFCWSWHGGTLTFSTPFWVPKWGPNLATWQRTSPRGESRHQQHPRWHPNKIQKNMDNLGYSPQDPTNWVGLRHSLTSLIPACHLRSAARSEATAAAEAARCAGSAAEANLGGDLRRFWMGNIPWWTNITTGWCPPVISGFINPMKTIVISAINHSYGTYKPT